MTPPPIDPLGYPAPPAYTEQEFDRKVSRAEEISLQTPAPQPPPASGSDLTDEQWAEIEEAAFQAAIAASLAEAGGSGNEVPQEGAAFQPGPPSPSRRRSPSSVRPLRIEKKNKGSVDLKDPKEQPKWLSEAQASSSSFQAGPSTQSAATHSFDRDEIPPPPFAEAAPSYSRREVAVIGFEQPAHAPSSEASSPPLSPLPDLNASSISAAVSEQEHSTRRNALPPHPAHHMERHPEPSPQHFESQSFDAYPRPTHPTLSVPTGAYQDQRPRHELRPPSSPSPSNFNSYWSAPSTPSRPSMGAPLVQFNPSVAYGKSPFQRIQKTPPPIPAIEEPRQEVYRANAFYNSAVSAHLPSTPQRPAHERTGVYQRQGNLPVYNTPQSNYRGFGGPGTMMESSYATQSRPTSSWSSPYSNHTNNRPLSTYSMDSVYSSVSSNSNPQQHYPVNSLSQSQLGQGYGNWPPSTPERFTNYR